MLLLLIEDDQKIASFIISGLQSAGYSVTHEDNGNTGLSQALYGEYDLIIVDIMLPYIDGLKIIEEIRKSNNQVPILILSAKREIKDRVLGLQTGSDDYLIKPFAFAELLARVQALIRRKNHDPEPVQLKIHDLYIDLLSREVKRGSQIIDLQPREFALLEYLIKNKNRVVSKTMIIENVWNYNFDPQTNVVEARISKLRDKIDKGFSLQLIHTIRGVGYVIKDTEEI